jgi:hypothetical protein
LVFPPTNHVAHGTPFDVSRTRSYGVENSMSRSFTTASQNHSTSSWERSTSSWYVEIPCSRMNLVTFARSMWPSLGRQTMSLIVSELPVRYPEGDVRA